ncbi:RNA-binding protein 34-like [Salvelinus sp. IW2-2015]|uniref:RNA-binding protein 34-like n=1 Tax=Salvelinus sp. IW2-2015 TaxID=2691554 RepID=UPI0038D4041B
MKNTLSGESEEGPSVDKQSMDYVVGSVSGSLFPMESASSSGSLSALFQAAPAVDTLFFVPAPKAISPKPELRSVELKEGTVTKVSNNQKQTKKAAKDKSAADLSLENRESALQNAYKAEQVPKMPKKTKRKAVEMGEGSAKEEERQTKKQRTGSQIAEARVKQKRTVFVGNLPASCTKKTLQLVFKDQGASESIRFRSVSVIPTCFKQTTIAPVPKNIKVICLNDYGPVALTSVAMNCFERLVMAHINTIIPETLDPLQFAYHTNRFTDDAITIALHTALSHLDKRNIM